MKHIKLFENYEDIESICNKYGIENYTINTNYTIDVIGDVRFFNKKLNKLPLQFSKIYGYFNCGNNDLTSLKGSPYHIGEYFNCQYNELDTLEYCPKYIGDSFNLRDNNIYSLDGIGKVGINIWINGNPIEELVYLFNNDIELYMEYLEIYNFQNSKIIYKTRFMEALNDIGKYQLPKLKNYIYH